MGVRKVIDFSGIRGGFILVSYPDGSKCESKSFRISAALQRTFLPTPLQNLRCTPCPINHPLF